MFLTDVLHYLLCNILVVPKMLGVFLSGAHIAYIVYILCIVYIVYTKRDNKKDCQTNNSIGICLLLTRSFRSMLNQV